MKLTEHFSFEEFIAAGQPVPDDAELVEKAKQLCQIILEPIRFYFNAPVHINSGYRSPAHNKEVGGAKGSYHMFEADHAAADIVVVGKTPVEVFDWIRLASGLPFDEVILEKDHHTGKPTVVHIQTNQKPRRRALIGETHGTSAYTEVEVA